tara:strand:+ start:1585 stop:2562 length:978 start_codon:yes stop_codon:yes gene_type:complete
MTVNVTKPALNIREKLAELDKPSGIAGEAMLRADSVQEQRNLIGAGRKNLIINGGMRVSQRGDYTTATAVANGTYYLDRWNIARSTVTGTLTHSTEVVSGVTSESLLLTATGTGSSHLAAHQPIEFPTAYRGRELTISAKIKSNSANTRISVWGGSGGTLGNSTAHTGSGGVETLTATFTVPSTTTIISGYIGLISTGTSNVSVTSGDYAEISNVQLELGSVATDFEHRSYGEELALCQRYFWRWDHDSGISNGVYASAPYDTGNHRNTVTFPVTLRTSPTVTFLNGTGSCSVDYRSPSNIGFYGTSPFRWDDTTAGYIAADAEL